MILDAAIEVHRTLGGPGLLESVYEECLVEELTRRSLRVRRQVPVPLNYKGKQLGTQLRVDLIVEDRVIVECKATTQYNVVFESQLLTYLRLTGLKAGLVLNFGERAMKQGVHRVVNGL
ncbi:GxxExxY protein [bacterium]|nr:GxxExxY protein [bacterium]